MKHRMPVIEVTDDNFLDILPTIKSAIKEASFLAIDCELTGLGNRKKLNEKNIDLRYEFASNVARSFAVISLGVSCFRCTSVNDVRVPEDNGEDSPEEGEQIRSHDYLVQTFDIVVLCSEDFSVEVKAHKFLLSHGFDFNKLYAKGVQYYRGCDHEENEIPTAREIFKAVIQHKKPLVIHNGLVDLMFLYQSFYADLPKTHDTFAADLSEMFMHGIYDTKYIFEFEHPMPATYLEYLYKKMQLKNSRRERMGDWHVRLKFPPYPQGLPNVDWLPYQQILLYNSETDDDGLELCENFAFHGWCPKNEKCEMSHNLNKIVKTIQVVGAKKRGGSKYSGPVSGSVVQIINHAIKKEEQHEKLHSQGDTVEPCIKKIKKSNVTVVEGIKSANGIHDMCAEDKAQSLVRAGGHRAGYDAFMTGFLFATHVAEHCELKSHLNPFTAECLGLSNLTNKIYLMGRDKPFLIRKGTYAKYSQKHMAMMAKIQKEAR